MSALARLCEEIAACRDCELAKHRTKVVPGEGAEDADLVFIGEAPGWHEDQQGRPFVGPAGQFLDQLLASIGLRREEVYIANVIKCRPPQNREPLPAEIQSCRKWLDRQIEIIQPQMIITLGRYSLARYFPNDSIGKIHGKPRKLEGVIYYPMYHPAAALHQGSLRRTIEADMLKIPQILAQSEDVSQDTVESQQLSLF
ncbi:MAG: uracil-DNA glycosylase [Chloroflexi bacterium RBG_13_50_10]|jgi:DNA polymerase|nr:MAG: uracil-DNA glycosylase [Chloroflexi bacterium RBG_13_50_10]